MNKVPEKLAITAPCVLLIFLAGCSNPTVDPCAGEECSGHGTCVEVGGEATCLCYRGYDPLGLECLPEGGDGDGDTDVDGDSDGDGFCTHTEDAESCEADCEAVCGDGACTHDETPDDCPRDCGADCGVGICTHTEDAESCEADCSAVCGDDACTHDEDAGTCEDDGPAECDDGDCTHDEDPESCPSDCIGELLTFAGYAEFGMSISVHDDATIDRNMNETCDYYYPGARAASNTEIVTGVIEDLPERNITGSSIVGACPYCTGLPYASAPSGHYRNYVRNGAVWPVSYFPWTDRNAGTGSYRAICVTH
jgi:hypothetical protein